MNEAAYVGATSITPGPRLIGGAPLAAAHQSMTWRADSPAACWWVDDDVVPPTSLNEGRGEVFPALEVLCWSYGKNGERVAQCGKVLNVERRVQVPFWEGREMGFPVACSSFGGAEDRPCCRGKVECVSNVIYQNVYLIRLINVSGLLSNYIPLIYQIAR